MSSLKLFLLFGILFFSLIKIVSSVDIDPDSYFIKFDLSSVSFGDYSATSSDVVVNITNDHDEVLCGKRYQDIVGSEIYCAVKKSNLHSGVNIVNLLVQDGISGQVLDQMELTIETEPTKVMKVTDEHAIIQVPKAFIAIGGTSLAFVGGFLARWLLLAPGPRLGIVQDAGDLLNISSSSSFSGFGGDSSSGSGDVFKGSLRFPTLRTTNYRSWRPMPKRASEDSGNKDVTSRSNEVTTTISYPFSATNDRSYGQEAANSVIETVDFSLEDPNYFEQQNFANSDNYFSYFEMQQQDHIINLNRYLSLQTNQISHILSNQQSQQDFLKSQNDTQRVLSHQLGALLSQQQLEKQVIDVILTDNQRFQSYFNQLLVDRNEIENLLLEIKSNRAKDTEERELREKLLLAEREQDHLQQQLDDRNEKFFENELKLNTLETQISSLKNTLLSIELELRRQNEDRMTTAASLLRPELTLEEKREVNIATDDHVVTNEVKEQALQQEQEPRYGSVNEKHDNVNVGAVEISEDSSVETEAIDDADGTVDAVNTQSNLRDLSAVESIGSAGATEDFGNTAIVEETTTTTTMTPSDNLQFAQSTSTTTEEAEVGNAHGSSTDPAVAVAQDESSQTSTFPIGSQSPFSSQSDLQNNVDNIETVSAEEYADINEYEEYEEYESHLIPEESASDTSPSSEFQEKNIEPLSTDSNDSISTGDSVDGTSVGAAIASPLISLKAREDSHSDQVELQSVSNQEDYSDEKLLNEDTIEIADETPIEKQEYPTHELSDSVGETDNSFDEAADTQLVIPSNISLRQRIGRAFQFGWPTNKYSLLRKVAVGVGLSALTLAASSSIQMDFSNINIFSLHHFQQKSKLNRSNKKENERNKNALSRIGLGAFGLGKWFASTKK